MTGSQATEVRELLAFWLNGTLAESEASRVRAALDADAGLRAELALLERLRDGMRDLDTDETPGEFGLARLHRSLAQDKPAVVAAPAAGRVWRVAAIAAALGAIAILLGQSLWRDDGVYRLASGDGGDRPEVTIAFADDATLAQVSELLLANGLTILDGPSALGLYRLGVTDPAAMPAATAALAAAPDLVVIVETPE